MCTVTYLSTKDGRLITSNRDENIERGLASAPDLRKIGTVTLAYPTDPKSQGTWIATKDSGEIVVLLNGAFKNHVKKAAYRQSRGIILLEIIKAPSPLKHFGNSDFTGIEQFTLIISTDEKLYECRWDGLSKHILEKDRFGSYIWSSATLYSNAVSALREKWFCAWRMKNKEITQMDAMFFHHFTGEGDSESSLVMDLENGISTMSITSVLATKRQVNMVHCDLKEDVTYTKTINRSFALNNYFKKLGRHVRTLKIKTLNWEYWPMHLVYAPMYLYWFYLSLKARSLFFFSAANPMRQHSGFAMEKKSDCYKHLPQQCYPKSIGFNSQTSTTDLLLALKKKEMDFPVIVKPEIGERGTGVKLVKTLPDLVQYVQSAKTDFLVQEFVTFEKEIGIFYYRMPSDKSGTLTGVVEKELLSVKGDGTSTIAALLNKNDRHFLQLPLLETTNPLALLEILKVDEERLLVPFGNHCRGALFTDVSHKISPSLIDVIDRVCKHLPEFYFGRLDIKYHSWEKLLQGEDFYIMEINGAASEPAHMYDPKHSIFFAWREIKKHWDLLYKISMVNARRSNKPLMNTAQGIKLLRAHIAYNKMLRE
ncbi:NRDE family protein [Pedobacter sandarakinus]|uniref:NRDE family protein n=1 Tax=Pedobacter sandarakinus TaxID=353156 RepID=UPI0022461CAD|nr:NRDE family protein [Pedobacter sandarakinus]MCX2575611.1 NRDE family protein [Pedobacter sandarakinus]